MSRKMMGPKRLAVLFVLLFAFGSGDVYSAEADFVGKTLPSFELEKPQSPAVQKYLGLESLQPFRLSQIPSKLVIIEVFSVLCQVCQKNAPQTNQLYQFIQRDSELKENVKMLGIGVGDDWKGLAVFKKMFRTGYPLFPDPENKIFELLDEPKIPFLIVINKDGKVVYTHMGPMKSKETFEEIKKLYKDL